MNIEKGIAEHLRSKAYPDCDVPEGRCERFRDCPACEAENAISYLREQGLVKVRYPNEGEDLTGSVIVFVEPI